MNKRENVPEENAVVQENPVKKEKKKDSGTKYSVKTYVIIMFSVVIVLILFSYLSQQRNILSISEQHSEFSTQALQNIENLQTQNLELVEENNQLNDQLEDLEEQLEELKETQEAQADAADQAEKAAEEAYSALEAKYKAVSLLADLQNAVIQEDMDAAKKIAAELKKIEQGLTDDQIDLFHIINNNLDKD